MTEIRRLLMFYGLMGFLIVAAVSMTLTQQEKMDVKPEKISYVSWIEGEWHFENNLREVTIEVVYYPKSCGKCFGYYNFIETPKGEKVRYFSGIIRQIHPNFFEFHKMDRYEGGADFELIGEVSPVEGSRMHLRTIFNNSFILGKIK